MQQEYLDQPRDKSLSVFPMKKLFTLITAIICASTGFTFAHGGGLDESGGHTDHKTGQYHKHR